MHRVISGSPFHNPRGTALHMRASKPDAVQTHQLAFKERIQTNASNSGWTDSAGMQASKTRTGAVCVFTLFSDEPTDACRGFSCPLKRGSASLREAGFIGENRHHNNRSRVLQPVAKFRLSMFLSLPPAPVVGCWNHLNLPVAILRGGRDEKGCAPEDHPEASAPAGALENSPARQGWETREGKAKSRRGGKKPRKDASPPRCRSAVLSGLTLSGRPVPLGCSSVAREGPSGRRWRVTSHLHPPHEAARRSPLETQAAS